MNEGTTTSKVISLLDERRKRAGGRIPWQDFIRSSEIYFHNEKKFDDFEAQEHHWTHPGEELKALRELYDLSVEDVANNIGVRPETIRKIEANLPVNRKNQTIKAYRLLIELKERWRSLQLYWMQTLLYAGLVEEKKG
jgi:DNA-binding XRE family transcriptional regulator